MPSERDLRVNQKVTVEVLAGPQAGKYSTHFVEEAKDGLVIAAPLVQGAALTPGAGTLLKVDYTGDAAAYSFESELVRLQTGVTPMWVLARPDTIQRMQRRTHVRLETSLPVLYTILARPDDPSPELSAQKNMSVYRGRTKDLSGGGSMLVLDQKLDSGTLVDLEVQLKPRETINLMGEIVRIIRTEDKGTFTEYWTGVRFLDIDDHQMDTIITFIFEEQRRLRRRGLI